MKRAIFLAGVALAIMSAPRNTSAQEVSFGLFYSSLEPYGEWVNTADYGMCWRPSGISLDWRPYTVGHWVWTEYGWTWVSGYPWGWAPFHYGRWILDSYHGWIWTPGYVWAPAWVQWRWGGGYCGWAPLPPGFHFRVDVVVGPDGHDFGVGPGGWSFVYAREMGSARYRFVDRHSFRQVFGDTRNVTRYRFTERGVYNVGLPREDVERVSRRPVRTANIVRTNDVGRQRVIGNTIHIYTPGTLEPRIRNEQEVIRRERIHQTPDRFRTGRREQSRPRQEMTQPRVREGQQTPRIERRREDSVRPRQDSPRKRAEGPARRDREDKSNNGPGHRH